MNRVVGVVVLFFILIISPVLAQEEAAFTFYIDDPLLIPYVTELEPAALFSEQKEAALIFYNGILESDERENAFDYTLGVTDVLRGEKNEMNPYALYSFEHLAQGVKSMAEVLALNYPARAHEYAARARLISKRLQDAKKDSKIDTSVILVMGEIFDYLLKEMDVKKITVDRFFIYREKATGIIPPAQILCESLPEGDLEIQLKYRRYFPVAVKREDFIRVEDFLRAVAEEVKHGKYSGS